MSQANGYQPSGEKTKGAPSCGDHKMKPLAAPPVPGTTDAERMDNAVRKFLSVPKEAYLREEERLKKLREQKKRAKRHV
jgi:hypothetical protein